MPELPCGVYNHRPKTYVMKNQSLWRYTEKEAWNTFDHFPWRHPKHLSTARIIQSLGIYQLYLEILVMSHKYQLHLTKAITKGGTKLPKLWGLAHDSINASNASILRWCNYHIRNFIFGLNDLLTYSSWNHKWFNFLSLLINWRWNPNNWYHGIYWRSVCDYKIIGSQHQLAQLEPVTGEWTIGPCFRHKNLRHFYNTGGKSKERWINMFPHEICINNKIPNNVEDT